MGSSRPYRALSDPPSRPRHGLSRLAWLMLCPLLGACGTVAKAPTPLENLPVEAVGAPAPYLLAPGDELEIAFFHTPELNTTVIVRPDGKIGLPLAQGLQAAGRTPEELAENLREQYRSELLDPDIAVNVRTFTDYQVHVGGEVGEPGVFPLNGRLTTLQAIFRAGGYLNRARLSEVLVLRRRAEGGHYVIPLDLARAIDGTDPSQDLVLRPYDAVLVPASRVANVNDFVELYIRNNLPVDFGIGFNPVRDFDND